MIIVFQVWYSKSQSTMSDYNQSKREKLHNTNLRFVILLTLRFYEKLLLMQLSGKLLSRMRKVAYMLVHKRGIQSGSRVALVFANSDPITFVCTLYGCMLAGIVPVAVEVPVSSNVIFILVFFLIIELLFLIGEFQDSGGSQLGFLLGSCGVDIALTCDSCMKCLPKNEKGEIIELRGKSFRISTPHWVLPTQFYS